jgi:hypothetical protein
MSVERVQRKSGAVWRVRWRENGQPHSRVLGSKRDAELFEADIKRSASDSSRRSTPGARPSPSSPASTGASTPSRTSQRARVRATRSSSTSTSSPASAACHCARSRPPSSPD